MFPDRYDLPNLEPVTGRHVSVAPLDWQADATDLFGAVGGSENVELWRYVPLGPFESLDALVDGFSAAQAQGRWMSFIFRDPLTSEALGTASYMRIRPGAGSVEVGSVIFGSKLKRTPAATEAMYLMMRHVFDDLGYRRYEWKCNDRNDASKRAAERLGFTFEGVFRQDMVVKGENRDTAWFSIIDSEWPGVKAGFEAWLDPSNFDSNGNQITRLEACRSSSRAQSV